MFLAFIAENGPKIVKKCKKGPKMGMNKWPISEKTYPPIGLKLGQNTILGPIIMILNVWYEFCVFYQMCLMCFGGFGCKCF